MTAFRYAKGVFDLVKWFLLAAFVLAAGNYFLATVFFVSGPSMEPNLPDGSAVFVNRLVVRMAEPRRGDLVVVRYPGDPEHTSYVKRVVGLPGESVKIQSGRVFINDQPLSEPYLAGEMMTFPNAVYSVPADHYFTMGDNRPVSNDSRYFGPIERRFISGRVELTIWPLTLYPEVIY